MFREAAMVCLLTFGALGSFYMYKSRKITAHRLIGQRCNDLLYNLEIDPTGENAEEVSQCISLVYKQGLNKFDLERLPPFKIDK